MNNIRKVSHLVLIITLFTAPATINAQVDVAAVIDSVINNTPPTKYYFIGQAHYNSANVSLEQELLFSLNRKYGLRYDIMEYGHSTAILLNEYLHTGEDSLLSLIHSTAPFTFIRAVKKFNDTAPEKRKIFFYGIDFEGRNYDDHLKKAIDIVLHKTKLQDTTTLYILLKKIKNNSSEKIPFLLRELKNYLAQNEIISRNQLGACYIDLLLVSNAQYDFSRKRDDAMYENFKKLYRELKERDANPLFLSSFGYTHINPINEISIATLLQTTHDSPVRNSVATIGIQYYRSSFHNQIKKKWTGNLNFLCNNKSLQTLQTTNPHPAIHFLSKSQIAFLSCNPAIKKFDGVILIANTPATSNYFWQ